jgi:HD-GYP domain-containing protein (c-di-GMP phosphodiesterase class II)
MLPNASSFRLSRIQAFVLLIGLLAALALVLSWNLGEVSPSSWGIATFALVGALFEISSVQLREGEAKGHVGFVGDLAAAVLFGGFWAGLLAAVATFVSNSAKRNQPIKVVFNAFQRCLSVATAVLVYQALGARLPPTFLLAPSSAPFEVVIQEILAFFAAALVYFVINSLAVSGAIALTSGRPFRNVWRANTLWILGYDLAASTFSLGVAWVYLKFVDSPGIERLGFLAVFLPIIAVRHIYGRLNTVQGLYAELDHAYENLELALREQLAMMVKSIEARDPYTSGHSKRVSAISRAIAIDAGFDGKLVEEIENAALLHDVGKIHAEFAPLLSKEGKLTPEEWEIMKSHSAKGAELVGLFSRFEGHVQDSVRFHHERWDGRGYPDGIKEEAIPLGARIIMIADTIDAMTTDRPYRKALGFEVVISELQKHRGTQFAPDLVESAINSVSIRRLISAEAGEPSEAIDGQVPETRMPPLRSHGSFFVGRRFGTESRSAG